MPLRSSGCFACRKRKIRCDEARPGCQRCATHGVTCSGYRGDKGGEFQFKDQTNVTVSRAKGMFKRGGAESKGKSGEVGRWSVVGGKAEDCSPDWMFCSTANEDRMSISPASTSSHTLSPQQTDETSLELCHRYNSTIALSILPSPALQRAALYQSFISTYLPRRTLTGVQEGHFSFFQTLALQHSTQPALQHGFDALSLVQIGSTYRDEGLLQQATEQYALALRALGRSIAKGDFLHDDEVLAAIVVLSSCELYEGIQVQGNGWSNHVQGANKLVSARGPESLQSDLALLLYANMRHGAMCHALIERKAPFLARKEWRDVAWRVPVKKDQSNMFYEWGIQVPGLLERHDKLDLESETALSDIDAILEESGDLELELRKWFAAWTAIADFSFGGLHTLVPITDFPTFLGLCTDSTFDHAYRFPDFLIGYLQTMYWMTMHFLRANIQSMHKKRHQILPDWYPEAGEEVQEEELLGYILDLCWSIPYFCEPETSSTGSIGIFLPMRTAAMYFTAHGHWMLLRWIGSVRNNVFVKGLRPPAVVGKAMSTNSPPNLSSAGSPSE